jgi:hypothetical protein
LCCAAPDVVQAWAPADAQPHDFSQVAVNWFVAEMQVETPHQTQIPAKPVAMEVSFELPTPPGAAWGGMGEATRTPVASPMAGGIAAAGQSSLLDTASLLAAGGVVIMIGFAAVWRRTG